MLAELQVTPSTIGTPELWAAPAWRSQAEMRPTIQSHPIAVGRDASILGQVLFHRPSLTKTRYHPNNRPDRRLRLVDLDVVATRVCEQLLAMR